MPGPEDKIKEKDETVIENPVETLIEELYAEGMLKSRKFEIPEYLENCKHDNIPNEILGCGDLNELAQFYIDNKNKLTETEKKFISERIVNNKNIKELSEKYRIGDLQYIINIDKTEKSFIFPQLKNCEKQSTDNGCWSCTLSMLLKSRGVNISQREVREYRAGVNKKHFTDISQSVRAPLLSDTDSSIDENLDILLKLLPNTGIHIKEVEGDDPGTKKREIVKTIEAALKNNSPISFNRGGHYMTIIGAKKNSKGNWILNVEDSLKDEVFKKPVSVDDLIRYSGTKITMSYLVDLKPDKNGVRKPIYNADLDNRIIYDNNEIKPLPGVDGANNNAGNNKEGFTFANSSFNEETGDIICDTIYVPKSLELNVPEMIVTKNKAPKKSDNIKKNVEIKKEAAKPSKQITDTKDYVSKIRENPHDVVKEINAVGKAMIQIKKSIRELEAAKTIVNSTQYKELINFLHDLEKPENIPVNFSKENFKNNMLKIGDLVDEYIDHKGKDGVKTNTYGKLAAVQKINVWLSDTLKDINVVRPKDYAELHTEYKAKGHDMTLAPEPGDVKLNAVAEKIKGSDMETIKAVDDCICTIILKADKDKRSNLINVRNEFNQGVLPETASKKMTL